MSYVFKLPEYLALSLKKLCCEFLSVTYFRTHQYTFSFSQSSQQILSMHCICRLDGETMINRFGLEHFSTVGETDTNSLFPQLDI